ncbi:MAG: hypothetical protein AB7H80_12510 [Candidatus Kapaibacterium sp.]
MSEQNQSKADIIANNKPEGIPFSEKKRNLFFIIIAALMATNIALTLLFPPVAHGARDLFGNVVGNEGLLKAMLQTTVMGAPMLGFIFGTLVAFLPYQNQKYSQKYLRASLLTIIVIELFLITNRISMLALS